MSSSHQPARRIPEIQSLRALASLLVVVYHASWIRGGYIGVDIFYVISGYLITGLLLRELERDKTINLRAFYLRRVKRLLPSSFIVLGVTALVSWWLFPVTMRAELAKDIFAAATYCSNFLFALWQMDYQNLNALPPVVIHYWSLAVEEQFYIFWPVIVLLAYRWRAKRGVLLAVSTITLLSFIVSLYMTSVSPIWAFYSLPARAWELGIGALLIFIPSRIKFSPRYGWLALFGISLSALAFTDITPFPGTAALLPVIATAFAIASTSTWPKPLKSLAGKSVVQWLGDISYPLYLWHWPILVIPAIVWHRDLTLLETLLAIVLTVVAAEVTHRYIEEPLRHSRFSPRQIVRYGAIATATSLALALSINVTSTVKVSIGTNTLSLEEITAPPKIKDDGCHLDNGERVSPSCTYGVVGKKSIGTVVLFGDSHAAQWFPAMEKLANENSFTLVSLTKSSCPAPAVEKADTTVFKEKDCIAWRNNSIERIQKIHPLAVIVSGMQFYKIPAEYSSTEEWWMQGVAKTRKALAGSSNNLIYLADTPHPLRDIPTCIASSELSICNQTPPTPRFVTSGWKIIDLSTWFCPSTCNAIIDDIVVYRDDSHISVAASEYLAPQLDRALRRYKVY